MINTCEGLLICDFAETYHIFNYRELPPTLVATLLIGLSNDSRVKRELNGDKLTLIEKLNALTVDVLRILAWQNTQDGHKNRNRPESLYKKLMGFDNPKKDLKSFATAEDFEKWYEAKMRK